MLKQHWIHTYSMKCFLNQQILSCRNRSACENFRCLKEVLILSWKVWNDCYIVCNYFLPSSSLLLVTCLVMWLFWNVWTSWHKPWLSACVWGRGRLGERGRGKTGGQFNYWAILNNHSKRWSSIWHRNLLITKMFPSSASLLRDKESAAFFPQNVFFHKVAAFQGGKCSDFLDSQLSLLYGFQNTSTNVISFHPHRHIYLGLKTLWDLLIKFTWLVEKLEHEHKAFGSISSKPWHTCVSSRSYLYALSNGYS